MSERMSDERLAELVKKWPFSPTSIWKSEHVAYELFEALTTERAIVDRVSELPEKWRKETSFPEDFIPQFEEESFELAVDGAFRKAANELESTLQEPTP